MTRPQRVDDLGDIGPLAAIVKRRRRRLEAAGVIDENEVRRLRPCQGFQFRYERALYIEFARVFTAPVAVEPEDGGLVQSRHDFRELRRPVAADELYVLVMSISFLGFLIELLSRFDGDDGREVRRRPTCAMSLEGTRFDEHVDGKGPLEYQYELLWRAPANDSHFIPPASDALLCRSPGSCLLSS